MRASTYQKLQRIEARLDVLKVDLGVQVTIGKDQFLVKYQGIYAFSTLEEVFAFTNGIKAGLKGKV